MRETVYGGKSYQEQDIEVQKAVALGGINMFRYYPKDRLAIIAETTVDRFSCKRFYPDMPKDLAEDMIHEDDRSIFYDIHQCVIQGERRASAIFRMKDGVTYIKIIFSVLETDESGNAATVVGMIEDVTDEQEGQDENAKLSCINRALSSNFNNVYLVDLEAGISKSYHISDVIKEEYGDMFQKGEYSPLIGIYIEKSVYEPDRQLFNHIRDIGHLAQTVREKGSDTFDYRVVRDGEIRYFQCRAVKVLIGSKDYCVIAFRDVNDEIMRDRKQKMQLSDALAKSERYEKLFLMTASHVYTGILMLELDTKKVNRLMLKGDKIVAEDVENWDEYVRKQLSYVHADDVQDLSDFLAVDTFLTMPLNEKRTCSYKSKGKNEAGNYRAFFSNAYRIEFDGKQYGIVVTIDNTEAVERELKQKELIADALDRAEAANKAKTTFLSNMSHDIRTPMNAIIGFTTLATTHIDQKEILKDYLGKIMSASNHLLSLINDVLDMSRIESGKIQLEETECSLAEVMHGLRDILQADMKSARLELYIDTVDVFDERVICDRLRLNQILLNILGNAVKFTEPGGKISVRISQKAADNEEYGNYTFQVKDTGIGMSEEFLEHIFEPFERERTSTVSGIQGTGLGMPITKNIVELMGGTIAVKSKKGEGTEFTIDLPMKKVSGKKKDIRISELQGIRALVVDDDFNTCDSVSEMLIQIGMRAEWTMSGREAILRTRQAVSRGDGYRVYVIDWLVSDMNGIEIARQIRREVGDNVPIIILTAYDWSEIEEEGREAGVTAFCSKPLFFSDLRRCLFRILHPEEEKKREERPAGKDISGQRILLVEDNDLNREIATEILSAEGLIVEEAEDGNIALEKLAQKGAGYYNLVLMDIQMPVMDGYEAAKKIRAFEDKRLADIPIIAMTANAFEEDKKRAFEAGMNDHIAKPIDVKKLLQAMGKIL